MSLLSSLLPERPLLDAEDLVKANLYKNLSQVQKAVDNGMPALRLGYRSLKFPRENLLQWLENQLTTSPKRKTKEKSPEDTSEDPIGAKPVPRSSYD